MFFDGLAKITSVLIVRKTLRKIFIRQVSSSKLPLAHDIQTSYLEKFRMSTPKHRENPIIMKLDTPEFKSIFTPELDVLANLFEKNGFEIRIAGGAVRDLLLGQKPKDLDFATTATPGQMKDLFERENIRMINAKGEKHGTITPRINDKENFEVTTLRIDVLTDGRHADVMFTTDWLLDANRRDLTINSMFLGIDGSVYDYFYGYDDLKKKRVAFVGDPDTRIKEDFLRILRYFRFYGKIADHPDNHEDSTLHTISENISGLERISGERIWSELRKILSGNFSGELMKTMLHVGVAKYIGLPEKPNLSEFDKVWSRASKNSLHPVTLFSALLNSEADVAEMQARLKLSAYERDLAYFLVQNREDKFHTNPILPYQRLVLSNKSKISDTKEWAIELLKYNNKMTLVKEMEEWVVPRFPISGRILMKHLNCSQGKIIGKVLQQLNLLWIESDFKMDSEELINLAPEIFENLNRNRDTNKSNK